MTFWIGVDEAGYGPNLGPLVVCASVWKTQSHIAPENWFDLLAPCFRRMDDCANDPDVSIVVDDSKAIYQSGKGLHALERNILALAELCDAPTHCADALRSWLDPQFAENSPSERWLQGPPRALPTTKSDQLNGPALKSIRDAKQKAGVHLQKLAGRILYPFEFNRKLSERDNKAAVLSETTIGLVQSLMTAFANQSEEDIVVLCDKHGGRDRYFALLTHFFPDDRIEILREGEAESAYRWRTSKRKREIRFCSKAERFPPTAAASMMAKYVRELCMAEWNAFWLARIPGLAPTAGYPTDARRFRKAIEKQMMELGCPESSYWRLK